MRDWCRCARDYSKQEKKKNKGPYVFMKKKRKSRQVKRGSIEFNDIPQRERQHVHKSSEGNGWTNVECYCFVGSTR